MQQTIKTTAYLNPQPDNCLYNRLPIELFLLSMVGVPCKDPHHAKILNRGYTQLNERRKQ